MPARTSRSAVPFGLHDIHGNVWEWVEDCWSDGYKGGPRDGSAWTTGNCNRRVLRGGSWFSRPRSLRAAYRYRTHSEIRYYIVGFRVAGTLPEASRREEEDDRRADKARTALAPPPKPVSPSAARPAVGKFPPWPGEAFRDCPDCPEMVVIPAGSFTMGSPAGEAGRYDDEGPRHRVTISRAFALGKYEVTFAEWDACARAGGCSHRPKDQGWGRGNRPVINVSWDDAKAYVRWLARKTGQEYRLPGEAEWEYAARAGTATARYWGEDADRACDYGNVHDRTSKSENKFDWAHHDCRDGYAKTAPVGSFRANDFGLHDVLGNVWEWVGDCWNDSYKGGPSDGSAWTTGNCTRRVLRGGSWISLPRFVRAAFRERYATGNRNNIYGFRVARTLP